MPRSFASLRLIALSALVALFVIACGGEPPETPKNTTHPAALGELAKAFEAEQTKDADSAAQAYLTVLKRVKDDRDPWGTAVALAAVDALVLRRTSVLDDVTPYSAIAYRSHASLAKDLGKVVKDAENLALRAAGTHAMVSLAETRGDEVDAEAWRKASGCAREALVYPPRDWATVSGLDAPSPLGRGTGALTAVRSRAPFDRPIDPVIYRNRGCIVSATAAAVTPGVRDIVTDLIVDKAGWIDVAIWSSAPAVVSAGGKRVVDRKYEDGPRDVLRMARLRVSKGRLRFVISASTPVGDEHLELQAWSTDGKPFAFSAPALGTVADAKAEETSVLEWPQAKTNDEQLVRALAFLAAGESARAETLANLERRTPALTLVYARAVRNAADLPAPARAERIEKASEELLGAWKGAWEPVLLSGSLAAMRKRLSRPWRHSPRRVAMSSATQSRSWICTRRRWRAGRSWRAWPTPAKRASRRCSQARPSSTSCPRSAKTDRETTS
jgi:hypothetical protein